MVVASYRKCAALLRLIFVRAYLQAGENYKRDRQKNQMSTHKNWVRYLQQRYSDQLLTIVTLLLGIAPIAVEIGREALPTLSR